MNHICWNSTSYWKAWRSSIARTQPRPLVDYRSACVLIINNNSHLAVMLWCRCVPRLCNWQICNYGVNVIGLLILEVNLYLRATGVRLWAPQKREKAKEMAVQKQWKRKQVHSPGTPTADGLLESHYFCCLYSRVFEFCLVLIWQVPSCISSQSPRLHASNPNLSTTESNTQELCPDSPDSPTEVSRLQQDFCRLANNSESTG